MSDLFNAGPARHTRGSFSVSLSGGGEVVKRLQKLRDGGEVAIKRTVSDFTSRGPGWVSKGIREHYGVDAAAIKEAAKRPSRGHTSIRVAGISVDGATLEYNGRTLTPIHFRMSPSTPHPKGLEEKWNAIPGQKVARKQSPHTKKTEDVVMARQPKPYRISATIIKGSREKMEKGTYLSPAKKGKDSPILPFQRTSEGRTPVEAIHTLSVPQMIEGKDGKKSRATDTISNIINENLEKRFNHHIERAMR